MRIRITIETITRDEDTETFRKTLKDMSPMYQIEVNEIRAVNHSLFTITSNDAYAFFLIGENFGRLKEFNSKK